MTKLDFKGQKIGDCCVCLTKNIGVYEFRMPCYDGGHIWVKCCQKCSHDIIKVIAEFEAKRNKEETKS